MFTFQKEMFPRNKACKVHYSVLFTLNAISVVHPYMSTKCIKGHII